MNARNAPPTLFSSVRSSRDHTLAAFAAALLAAFALHAGAFLPRLRPEAPAAPSASTQSLTASRTPAARRPPMLRAADAARAEPCPAPRG